MKNFSIYDYINSKSIAEHCKKIGKKFNSFESVLIVYHCRCPLAKKHIAYEQIMNTMEEVRVEAHMFNDPLDTWYEKLQDFIDMQKKLIKQFYLHQEEYSYRFEYMYSEEKTYDFEEIIYDNLEELFKQVRGKNKELRMPFKVMKHKIDDWEHITLYFDENEEVIGCEAEGDKYNNIEQSLWLEYYKFYLPLPFKEGDLVAYKSTNMKQFQKVILSFVNSDSGITPDKRIFGSDYTDMIMRGYGLDEKGRVYDDDYILFIHDIIEINENPLTGYDVFLSTIKQYMKDEISAEEYLCRYKELVCDIEDLARDEE